MPLTCDTIAPVYIRKGGYKEIRKSLAHVDGKGKMKNLTSRKCWTILRSEPYSAIDIYVPMKRQGKRSNKKHLSIEAFTSFRKIIYKQDVWRVYKHTGNDKDYEAHKEPLNAATNEVRKSNRNFEHKLVQNNNTGIFNGRGIKFALQFSVHERRY